MASFYDFSIRFWNCYYIVVFIVLHFTSNRIGGVMVLASSAIDCGIVGQNKDYKIGICYLSAKYPTLRTESKDWLAQNQNNVSEWIDMSTCRLLFQSASTIAIKLSLFF